MELDNENTPYLRLPPPHNSITLNIYRATDAPVLISMLNHPGVYMNLAGPPFPYLQEHHDSKIKELEADIVSVLKYLREFKNSNGNAKWASAVPFTVIREVDEDTGQQTVLGDLVLRRSDFLDINDEKERERMKSRNDNLEAGDSDIVWEIGC